MKVDHYVQCGALKNTAKVRATDEPAANRDDNASSVTDDVACVPSIALETTAPTYAHAGASVPFTMRVHNDGQTSLGSVDLTGPGLLPRPDRRRQRRCGRWRSARAGPSAVRGISTVRARIA